MRAGLAGVVSVLLLVAPAAAQQDTANPTRRVLVLFAERASLPATIVIDSAFRAEFARVFRQPYEIQSEYLDLAGELPSGEVRPEQVRWLRRKYADRKFDAVVAVSRPALDVMSNRATSIVPGVPLVFWVVDDAQRNWQPPPAAVTGLVAKFSYAATILDALMLFPRTTELLVVSGASAGEAELVEQSRRELQALSSRLRVEYLIGATRAELTRRLAAQTEQSLTLFLSLLVDSAGNEYTPRDVLTAIAPVSKAPIVGLSSTYIGTGIVGGRLMDLGDHGRGLARLTVRFLDGSPDLPIVQATSDRAVFDARALDRWGVTRDRLPPGSEVRFAKLTLWRRSRSEIVILGSLCLLQTMLIAGLLVQRRKGARAEQMVADRLRFETVLADASRTFTEVTGDQVHYELDRWLGRVGVAAGAGQVALLLLDDVADRLVAAHQWKRTRRADRALIISNTDLECIRRGVVVTRTLSAQAALVLVPLSAAGRIWGALALETHNETPFGEAVQPSRLRLLGEVLANALARNRAAAELAARSLALAESHAEYHRLADRLIQAQENERRRIARELHDDITQRLTLIGLAAGEVGRHDGEAAVVPRIALERLSEDLSTLIGDVTRLSHRLHPTLIGRLGLPAAVRALCRDLSGQQGLHVSFVEKGVTAELPEAQSLAAFRVAQEALRNALKHSHARQAAVQLAVQDNALALEVTDDGQGFDTEGPREGGGLGLLSMTERVQVLDGTLTVQSRPGLGTTVRVVLPLARDAARAPENPVDVQFPARPDDL